jgi:hypothetical protein
MALFAEGNSKDRSMYEGESNAFGLGCLFSHHLWNACGVLNTLLSSQNPKNHKDSMALTFMELTG